MPLFQDSLSFINEMIDDYRHDSWNFAVMLQNGLHYRVSSQSINDLLLLTL
ncbi:uncharacterized protein FMAN_14088 [Fusarium mangiferae]|uniref:Uncharacterized protein n=1 Tax=Fusarium mangiferae TaxID=192010 RepID=A0A1L7UK84_FUSMA|nr:uncharacterized protein FMAN_14088 [Fusarium mangiferae]CVL08843.1 uncharacterized protein FMAN_14088 [Fusarium mangiferae]